ncbi:PREDICTED: putative odorant receptor 85d [Nicrophorus vespilloides]|uniref:Odorant receptor 85d n=1 Tax=Nicrophorus vespilloides TaxID=110193 RepID=A0ABM1MTC8_NICVS|nr:PREDICTED: putative odorant receptor 85d [Nicrophorus vespilloides]
MIAGNKPYLLTDIIDDIATSSAGFGLFWSALAFMSKSQRVDGFVDMLKDTKFGKPPRFDKMNKLMNLVGLGLGAYSFFGVIFLSAINLFYPGTCEHEKIKYNVEKTCGFLTLFRFPIDVDKSPIKEIYWLILTSSCTMLTGSSSLIMGFIVSLNEMRIVKIQHLKDKFRETFKIADFDQRKKHFHECIAYHTHILSLNDEFNDIFGQVFLMYITFGSAIMSLVGFQCTIDTQLKTTIHFIGWFNIMLTTCYTGQRLLNESNSLIEIYSMEWYLGDLSMQKDVCFVLRRSHIIMNLSAMGFSDLSLAKFSAIMQNIYQIVTLLRQTSNAENVLKNAGN